MIITRSKFLLVAGVIQNFPIERVSARFGITDPLMYFAFTRCSNSINFTNLSVYVCSTQVSSRQKSIPDRTWYGSGGSIILSILKIQNRAHRLLTQLLLNTIVLMECRDTTQSFVAARARPFYAFS